MLSWAQTLIPRKRLPGALCRSQRLMERWSWSVQVKPCHPFYLVPIRSPLHDRLIQMVICNSVQVTAIQRR